MKQRPQVLLLTNVPAPTRLPVFEALTECVDLTVFFCQARASDRLWRVELRSERVKYETAAARVLPLPGGVEIIWDPGLWTRLHQAPFDVYIAGENFTNFPSVLTMWRAARHWKKPFILWSGAIDTRYASGNLLSNTYRRWLYRRTDAFIAYGQRPKAYLVRRGAAPDRIVLGLQVVPSEQLPPPAADRSQLGLTGRTVVLYVGYFVARKGVRHLIRAFQTVAGENDVLALLGSGPEEPTLRLMSHGDSRILFPGYLDGPEKSSWYAAADVFVLPTLHDPWGLVVNEAMAFGLPILITEAAGCVPDIVKDKENGIVIPAGDVNALSAALAHLLNNADLRQRMGQRSRAIIADYTTQAARDKFLEVIEYALKQR
jgi:glycosyltransferase involved in cell wall biosynthesis